MTTTRKETRLRLAKDITKELDRKNTSTSNSHQRKAIQGLAKDITREGNRKTNNISNFPQRKAIQRQENQEM